MITNVSQWILTMLRNAAFHCCLRQYKGEKTWKTTPPPTEIRKQTGARDTRISYMSTGNDIEIYGICTEIYQIYRTCKDFIGCICFL